MTDYRRLFEVAFDLMCVASPTHLLEVNPALVTKLGYSEEELKTRSFLELVHPDDVPTTLRLISAGSIPTEVMENRWVCKDGSVLWLRWHFHPVMDAGGVVYAVAQDITETRTAEARLRGTIEDLRRSNAELQQFAYVASHDLREPLRMVSNYLTLLEEELGPTLTPDAHTYLGFAVDGAKRLQVLITDLLTYSRVGRFMKPANLPADVALDDALAILNGMVAERGATLHRQALPSVYADRPMISRLFLNLVGNALKFRRDDVPLEISIQAAPDPDTDGMVRFAVRDNGRGFDMKHAERIFVIFQRFAPDKHGTGIGLAECRKIVEQHGGRIWAESYPGQGATFYFTLRKETPEVEE